MVDSDLNRLFKEAVRLNSDESAIDAITQIAQFLVRSIQRNEDGILEDIDTEFLHQYRVSIRKLRSLLGLIKGVFPPEDSNRLRAAFGGYATDTNTLRDLDVYLQDEAAYRACLDPSLDNGLDILFDDLRIERNREFQRIKRLFVSKDYRQRRKFDQEWFFQPLLPHGPSADKSIYKLATGQIYRRYKSICKRGKPIGTGTSDNEIHKLRIECKKLRYMLELFSSLFAPKKVSRIVRHLKSLQTKLGRFNDTCIQRQFLLSRLEKSESLPVSAAAAIGGLVTSLSQSRQNALEVISKRVDAFSDPKTRALMKSLLNHKR